MFMYEKSHVIGLHIRNFKHFYKLKTYNSYFTLVSRMHNQTYEAGIQNKDKIETIQELVTSIYFKSPSFRHFRRYCLQLRWPQRLPMKWFEPGIFSAPLRSGYFSLRSLSLFSSLCLLAISAFPPHSSK